MDKPKYRISWTKGGIFYLWMGVLKDYFVIPINDAAVFQLENELGNDIDRYYTLIRLRHSLHYVKREPFQYTLNCPEIAL